MSATGTDPDALIGRFFNVTQDLVCVADGERLLRVNHRWTDLLGWSEEHLLARPYIDLVHPADRDETLARITRVQQGDDLPVFEHRVATKDGGWKTLAWNARRDPASGLMLGSARDVTDERETRLERDRLNSVLGALSELQSSYIASGLSRDWWETALRHLIDLTGSEFGFVGRVDHDEDGAPFLLSYAVTDIAWNDWSREHYDAFVEQGLEFHNLETLFGATLRTGELVISLDPLHDPRAGGLPEGHPPLLAYAGIPLIDGDGMVGMIGLANRPGGFDTALIDTLAPLSALLSQIISRDVMSERAQTDPLTGLPNRNAFVQRIEELLSPENRRRGGIGVLLLDLDGFKAINDTLGHLEGDRVLIEAAEAASGALRRDDMIARLGGDEFAVLVTQAEPDELERTALRLRDAVARLESSPGKALGVSVGGAWVTGDGATPPDWEALYATADSRLYEAKRLGGGSVVTATG